MSTTFNPLKPPAAVLLVVGLLMGTVLAHGLGEALDAFKVAEVVTVGFQVITVLLTVGLLFCFVGASTDKLESLLNGVDVGCLAAADATSLALICAHCGSQFRPPRDPS
jgi:hypothetical protein